MSTQFSPTGNSAMKVYISEELTKELKAPLNNLPSFLITAIMLSYYGVHREAAELLQVLSHSTRAYYMKHKDLIKNFTVMFRKMPYFGKAITQESDNCRYFQWPP